MNFAPGIKEQILRTWNIVITVVMLAQPRPYNI